MSLKFELSSEPQDGQTFIGLLKTLNPTPAVCGESRPVATEFIRRQVQKSTYITKLTLGPYVLQGHASRGF